MALPFVLVRPDVVERGVQTVAFAPREGVRECDGCRLRRGEGVMREEFVLDRRKETFGEGVIPAVPGATHAGHDAGRREDAAIGEARVWIIPVTVHSRPRQDAVHDFR